MGCFFDAEICIKEVYLSLRNCPFHIRHNKHLHGYILEHLYILYKRKDHYAPPLPRCPVCNSAMLKKITTGSKFLAAATLGIPTFALLLSLTYKHNTTYLPPLQLFPAESRTYFLFITRQSLHTYHPLQYYSLFHFSLHSENIHHILISIRLDN